MKKRIFLVGPRATRSRIKNKNVGALGTRMCRYRKSWKTVVANEEAGLEEYGVHCFE